jgi:hypothetical protein
MKEVSKEKFYEVLKKTPYTTSFVLGSKGMRYNGTKGLFKGSMFGKEVDGKYYLNEAFLK